MKPSVAIDFDGVLCEEAWPDIGCASADIINAARHARDAGVRLILNTCREGAALEDAVSFCESRGLGFDAVNENLPERIQYFGGDCRKVSATYIVDDRAVGYTAEAAIELLLRLAGKQG